MRCYLMKDGRISAVEFLKASEDIARIEEAKKVFDVKRREGGYDGFEVWDGSRFVYRSPTAVAPTYRH